MSTTLINVAQTLYNEEVHLEYQSRGFILRDTMRMRSDVVGSTCQFRKVGTVIAVPLGYQDQVSGQDPDYTAWTATLQKYVTPIYVDTIEQLTVNFDAKRESVQCIAAALGRRSDQIAINALAAANTANTVANGGTNMTYAKFRQMVRYFESNAVPPRDRFIAMSGNNLAALLDDEKAISNRFTDNYAVYSGTLQEAQMMGSNIRIIPDMQEGGLPKTNDIRTCFAWHREAMGFAVGQDMRVEINYVPEKTSWLVNGLFFAGAVGIDTLGIVEIDCDESVGF